MLYVEPFITTGFEIAASYFTPTGAVIMFEWDPPNGSGPEAVVENYTISILPMPISHPIFNVVITTSWNVTLDYNVIYNATITALNCAGESNPNVITNIQHG